MTDALMTRARLRQLAEAKINARVRLGVADLANKRAENIDQRLDAEMEYQRATTAFGKTDIALAEALERFDREKTQDQVLAGVQPKGDKALLADFGDALPLDPERFDEATGPCDGKGD